MHRHTRALLLGSLFCTFMGVTTGLFLGRGPDFELKIERQVVSRLSTEDLDSTWLQVDQWPDWHFNSKKIEILKDPKSEALASGTRIVLFLEPPKKEWKRSKLELQIEDYTPKRLLKVSLQEDSKGRLEKLLTEIEWTIELLPLTGKSGTIVKAEAKAKTHGAKGRIFGRIAGRALMNQILYPDIEAFANPERRKGNLNDKEPRSPLPF